MRVLFVSKPIVAPFHDGTRCFVRDVARNLPTARATVLSLPGEAPLGPGIEAEPVYAAPGGFAPALLDNARVLRRLLLGPRHDLWHFVFAPNPRSSHAARLAVLARRVPTLQTVASVPRTFEGSSRLLFGARVVCQSQSTRDRLVAAGAPAGRIDVILPPLSFPAPIPHEQQRQALAALGLVDAPGPLLVYPGDLEFSGGAPAVASAIPEILRRIPEATIVLACRAKTPKAHAIADALRARLAPHGPRVVFAGQVPSLPALLAASSAVLFPVDDLYGKVDLPLSLLEAQALGVPVIALQQGPLCELQGAVPLPRIDRLAEVTIDLLRDDLAWRQHSNTGKTAVLARHDPALIAAAYEDLYRRIL
ncbi:MAG: glycosyltransferase family 4 protein [Polyangiaceae bacterium]|jgi:phosphatidylinositol alpha-1,6-mannosyltransferase|nr:glycosyltransferase family 4 protein [Polyangiaceae bacterium]